MKRILILLLTAAMAAACSPKSRFVTVENGRFMADGKPYSYVGANFWYGAILGSQSEGGDRERHLRILVGGDGPDGVPSRIEPT